MKAVIFLNGEYNYKKEFIQELINKEDLIFCADGGANYTYKYDLTPSYIIGDLDSVEPSILEYYKNKEINIKKYNPEKDFTDFELILQKIEIFQKENNIIFEKIYVLGGLGKRIDMTLNNLHLMEEYKNIIFLYKIDNEEKYEEIYYKEKSFEIKGKKEHKISFISLDKRIEKLTLQGFKYNLTNKDIERKNSRLVSNIIISNNSIVKFNKGRLLVIIEK